MENNMNKIVNQNKNYLFTNMFSYALLQVVNMLVGLLLPRLYLAVYGSEINGVVSTINSFITYFSYLEAGIGLTLIHSLFKPLAENNSNKTNEILSFSKKQYQKISGIYFFLVVVLSIVFPLARSAEAMGKLEFMTLVFVIGFYGALDFYTMAKYRVLLTADRKEYVLSNAMIAAQLLRFVFVWTLLQFDLSIILVKTVPIFTLLIRSFILKIYVKKNYPTLDFSVRECSDIEITGNRWDALLLQISISTSTSLPTMIISQVLGFKEANVYAVYSLVINAMIAIVSALSSGVSPMLGRSIALGKDINKIYDLYDYVVTFVLTVAFSITGVLLIPFIKIYTNVVNDINYIYPLYAILISIWGALYSYRIPLTAVINAAGIYRENRTNNMVNLSIQLIAGIFSVVFWGISGLLIVMIVSALHRNIGYGIVNSKILLHNKISKSIVRQAVMVFCIISSYFIMTSIFTSVKWNVMMWIIVAIAVTIVEIIVCSIIFVILDRESAKKMIGLIKDIN